MIRKAESYEEQGSFFQGRPPTTTPPGRNCCSVVLTFLLASLALIFTSLHPGKNANAGSQFGVYVGSGDGAIFKLDAANGQQLWRYKTKGSSIPAPVTDSNGMIYAGGLDGIVYALSTADGKLNWSFQTQGPVLSSPTVANGLVYVGSSDGNLYGLDAKKRHSNLALPRWASHCSS